MLTLLVKVLFTASLLGQLCALAAPMDPHWPGGNWPNPYGNWQPPEQSGSHSYTQPNHWAGHFDIDADLQRQPGYEHPANQYPATQYPVNHHFIDHQNLAAYQYHHEEPSGHDWNIVHAAGPSYSSQHYPDWQDVPASHLPASQERLPSPSPQDEQAFLDSLLEELSQSQASHSAASHEHPSPLPHEQNAFVDSLFENFSPYPTSHSSASYEPSPSPRARKNALLDSLLERFSQNENTGSAAGSSVGGQDILADAMQNENSRKFKVAAFRKEIGWPEPTMLSQIPYIENMLHTRANGKLQFGKEGSDIDMRNLINTEVFNGHLQWHDVADVPAFQIKMSRRSPVWHASRELPIPPVPAPEGTRAKYVKVYFVEHNVVNGDSNKIQIDRSSRPFYAFWGMPDISEAKQNTVYFYGLGVLDKEHSDDVDAFLKIKAAARQAIQGHPM